jgi:hypothetical protein
LRYGSTGSWWGPRPPLSAVTSVDLQEAFPTGHGGDTVTLLCYATSVEQYQVLQPPRGARSLAVQGQGTRPVAGTPETACRTARLRSRRPVWGNGRRGRRDPWPQRSCRSFIAQTILPGLPASRITTYIVLGHRCCIGQSVVACGRAAEEHSVRWAEPRTATRCCTARGSRVLAPAGLRSMVAGETRGQDGLRLSSAAVTPAVCCQRATGPGVPSASAGGCAELACARPTSGSRPRMALPAA